jgi:hypothetical protein
VTREGINEGCWVRPGFYRSAIHKFSGPDKNRSTNPGVRGGSRSYTNIYFPAPIFHRNAAQSTSSRSTNNASRIPGLTHVAIYKYCSQLLRLQPMIARWSSETWQLRPDSHDRVPRMGCRERLCTETSCVTGSRGR